MKANRDIESLLMKVYKTFMLLVGLFLLYAAFYQVFYRIDQEPVKIWDEASSAKNAIEMLYNKNYLVVHSDGKPDHFDTRPPMSVWTKVFFYHFFGIDQLSTRLPSIVAAFFTFIILLLFLFKLFKNFKYVMVILILIGSTLGYNTYHVARTGDPDVLLTFFTTAYILVYFLLLEFYPKHRVQYYLLLGIAVVGAVLTKSILGLAPLAGLLIYTFTQVSGYKLLKDYRFHLCWVISLMVIASYYLLREQVDKGYLLAVLRMEFNVINKPAVVKHPEFSFYYTYLKEIGFAPFFSYLYIPFIPLLFSKNNRARRLLLYSLLGASFYLLGQSSVTIKNEWYIAPIYPFLWLFAAVGYVETAKMVANFIQSKWWKALVFLSALALLLYISVPQYFYITEKNTSNPYQYEYPPERAGKFIESVKSKIPEIKNLTIISPHPDRQMKFYANKYKFQDSTQIKIMHAWPVEDLLGNTVLLCEDSLKQKLEGIYTYSVLHQEKYCTLYLIKGQLKNDTLLSRQ